MYRHRYNTRANGHKFAGFSQKPYKSSFQGSRPQFVVSTPNTTANLTGVQTLKKYEGDLNDTNRQNLEMLVTFSGEMSKFSAKVEDDPKSTRPLIDPALCKCVVNPETLYCTPLLDNYDIFDAYYSDIVKHYDLPDATKAVYADIPQNCAHGREHRFITSFGLVPGNKMQASEKDTFLTSHQLSSITHAALEFGVYGVMEIPVFGLCVQEGDLRNAMKKYDDNPKAREFVTDAMITLNQIAHRYRKDNNFKTLRHKAVIDTSKKENDPNRKKYVYCNPSTPVSRITKKEFTSHANVFTYSTTITANYKYGETPRKMQGDALITAIHTSIIFETVTILPVRQRSYDYDQRHIKDYTSPEIILSQTVGYTATYYGTNVPDRGYEMKMVTVNTGCEGSTLPKWKRSLSKQTTDPREWSEKIGMMVYDIGNGLPVQYILTSDEKSSNNTSSIRAEKTERTACAELVHAAITRALRAAISKSTKPVENGFVSKNYEKVNEKIKEGVAKNKPRVNKYKANIQYMNISDVNCGTDQGIISTGTEDSYFDSRMPWRSESVTILGCVGTSMTTSNVWIPPVHERTSDILKMNSPFEQTFQPFDSCASIMGSELDMEEIMSMAARPSAFDD